MSDQNCGLDSTPKKISEVEEQFIYCDKVRVQLAEVITTLADRLAPVLRQQNPSTEGECEKEQLTSMAESIKKNGREMEYFTRRIRDIIDRLEI